MFPSYDRETLLRFALATLHNRMDVDVTPGTFWYKVAETWAEATTSLSGYQQHIARQILPSTAETAALERHAKVRGLVRKTARRAEGVVSIVLTAE